MLGIVPSVPRAEQHSWEEFKLQATLLGTAGFIRAQGIRALLRVAPY